MLHYNMQTQIQNLSTTNLQLQTQIDQLKAQLRSETYYRVLAQKSLQESTATIQNLEEQLYKSTNRYSEILEKYSFAVKELSSTIQSNSELLESRDREISKLLEEKKALKEELLDGKLEKQNLREEIDKLRILNSFKSSKTILETSKNYEKQIVKTAKLQTVQAEKRRVKKAKKYPKEIKMATILEEEDTEEFSQTNKKVIPFKIPTLVDVKIAPKSIKMDTIQEDSEDVEDSDCMTDSDGSWVEVNLH